MNAQNGIVESKDGRTDGDDKDGGGGGGGGGGGWREWRVEERKSKERKEENEDPHHRESSGYDRIFPPNQRIERLSNGRKIQTLRSTVHA